MNVQLIKKKMHAGNVAPIQVLVNGKKVQNLTKNQSVTEVHQPGDESVDLQCKQWLFGSNTVKVSDNDQVHLSPQSLPVNLYYLAVITLVLANLLLPHLTRQWLLANLAGVGILLVTLIISFKSWLKLEVVKQEPDKELAAGDQSEAE